MLVFLLVHKVELVSAIRKCGTLLKSFFVTLLISTTIALFFHLKMKKLKRRYKCFLWSRVFNISDKLMVSRPFIFFTVVSYLIIRLYRFEKKKYFYNWLV